MFGTYFYNESMRRMTIGFGQIFNNIQIKRKDSSGNVVQSIRVPLAYAPKEKFLARLDQQANLQEREFSVTLPRMSFEISGIQYDASRKLTRVQKYKTVKSGIDGKVMNFNYTPVPYNVSYNLYSFTASAEAGLQIVEQILPFFQPDFTVTVNAIPELDTGLYRWLTATDPKEEGFIQSKLKFALSEALPIQFGYSGIRGLNRSGRIGFKSASGEVIDLGRFLVDGVMDKFKAIKENPDLVTAITNKLTETRGFKPNIDFNHLDEIKWNELSLDSKLDELFKRNDIIIESLADEDLADLSYVNRAIGELNVNGNLTEENLNQSTLKDF